jgi:hypothetical protein
MTLFTRGTLIIFTLILLTILVTAFLLQYGFSVPAVAKDIINGFTNYGQYGRTIGANVRIDQTLALIGAWKEKPLFGFGTGAVYWEYIRNSESPWQYEVSYAQFLYNWGIVGCMLYAIGLYYIYRTLIRIYKTGSKLGIYALAATYGSAAFLIGSFTNPYLLRFDSLFVIFLPIAIVNLYLLKEGQIKKFTSHVELQSNNYRNREEEPV